MSKNVSLLLYAVDDLVAAKKLFGTFLDAEPYADSPYYVGYKVGELEVGLTPKGNNNNGGTPTAYTEVTDIKTSLQSLLDAGATLVHEPKDVGGGLLVAAVTDSAGNMLGLRQGK